MATFDRLESIGVSHWEDPLSIPSTFVRDTADAEAKLPPIVLPLPPMREERQTATDDTNVTGKRALFLAFQGVDFDRDSDLLLRHTPRHGEVLIRRDGTFYPAPLGVAPADALGERRDLILTDQAYGALVHLIANNLVQKRMLVPGLPFEGSTLLVFKGTAGGEPHVREASVRVSGMPSLGSWSVCIRFIPASGQLRKLDDIYLLPAFQEAIRDELLTQGHGLLLISGPIGHGKTTAAYSILRELVRNRSGDLRHLLTIEDPIECRLEDATQVEVNLKAEYGFADAFHGALRHAPEVFFFGEIRSAEAAAAATQAAMSGHFTVATIHGASPMDTIGRLLGFGISPRTLSTVLLAVINHRLVPKLCDQPTCSGPLGNSAFDMELIQWAYRNSTITPPQGNLRCRLVWPNCLVCAGHGKASRVLLASITRNGSPLRRWLLLGAAADAAPAVENHAVSLSACAATLALRGDLAVEEAYSYSLESREENPAQ